MPRCRWFCLGLFALCALSVTLLGQTFYGSIVGSVTDSSGSGMPGAAVTVVNTSTSERHAAVITIDGGYRFVNLVPGYSAILVDKA